MQESALKQSRTGHVVSPPFQTDFSPGAVLFEMGAVRRGRLGQLIDLGQHVA